MWMSDAFAEMMLGHLVCLVQGNAFILVEWAYLGRGKLRWPVLWAELLCMGQLGLSLATGMSFFNVQSVLLNVLYLFVTAQLFGGNFADKLTACLINGTMCLLVENTVNYTSRSRKDAFDQYGPIGEKAVPKRPQSFRNCKL